MFFIRVSSQLVIFYPLFITCVLIAKFPHFLPFFVLPNASSDTLSLPDLCVCLCSCLQSCVSLLSGHTAQVSLALRLPIPHFGVSMALLPWETSCPRCSLPASAAQYGALLQGSSPKMSQWTGWQAGNSTAQQQKGQSCPVLESRPPWLWPLGSLFFKLFEHWFLWASSSGSVDSHVGSWDKLIMN